MITTVAAILAPPVLAGAPVEAQPPELVTDRPDQTESAVTVPAGLVQVETGFLATDDDEGSVRTETLEGPGTLVRIGLLEKTELRLGWRGWVSEEIRTAGSRYELDGSGDAEMGVKQLLTVEDGSRPQVALLTSLSIPIGEEDFSSKRIDPAIRLALSHTLSDAVGLGYNIGIEWDSEDRNAMGRSTLSRLIYTVATGFSLSDKLGLFTELFGSFPGSDSGTDKHSFDGGLTWLINARLQLDLAAGLGLNDSADDWFAGVGVSFRTRS